MSRAENIKIFQDTMKQCSENKILYNAIADSKKRQYVLKDEDSIIVDKEPCFESQILISKNKTFEAAEKYNGKKVCVLNFADSISAGGGVVNGATAQEEALCRISTLYPCISCDEMQAGFYSPHAEFVDYPLYNDDLIYTPDVVVFKSDTDNPETLPENEWYKTDVITCAAPNLSRISAIKRQLIGIYVRRIERIVATAVNEGAEVIVLGAFGCGAFRNPPDLVAKVMNEIAKKYMGYYDTMEFAVYCPPSNQKNYDIFRNIIDGVQIT